MAPEPRALAVLSARSIAASGNFAPRLGVQPRPGEKSGNNGQERCTLALRTCEAGSCWERLVPF
jgi:hypothetical protein